MNRGLFVHSGRSIHSMWRTISTCAAWTLIGLLLGGPFGARAQGSITTEVKISDTSGGFTGVLDNADLFGWSVSGIGDIDDDRVTDRVVGILT